MDPQGLPSSDGGDDEAILPVESTVDEALTDQAPVIEETICYIAPDGTSGTKAATTSTTDVEPQVSEAIPEVMASRAYQREMLEQSLKRNVIVAMDTGSGKTQVAVLRIRAELERGSDGKLIWFLAPTTALCAQQYEVIQKQLLSVKIQLLIGSQKLESWSPSTWSHVLNGTQVVISTFQVLLDALSHAFVSLSHLSLLVFDEAHNCTKKHPGSKIMIDFYHELKKARQPVPAILGLTASPIMNSRIQSIGTLEATLDAICVAPTLHREELLKFVNRPQLSSLTYQLPEFPPITPTMQSFRTVFQIMDISEDPEILKLLSDKRRSSRQRLKDAIEKHDTFAQKQMSGLWRRSQDMSRELGPWAGDYFMQKAIGEFLNQLSAPKEAFFDQSLDADKAYIGRFLRQVVLNPPSNNPVESSEVSQKVQLLVETLLSVQGTPVGIVFVKERAMVSILYDLLSSSPKILEKYRLGKMVGSSTYGDLKKNIYEFDDCVDLLALQNFRSGKVNLLIATSVLEEGIDVPACNLIVCFDTPSNLKAFIQRRGRARMRESRLVLLLDQSAKGPIEWEALEQEMKQQYEDEDAEFRKIQELEESEDTGTDTYVVHTTGARLNFDNAKQHLEHFCRVLTTGEFIDCRPDYVLRRETAASGLWLTATVILPSFLEFELRTAKSASAWKSEKNATKDAAFQAYVALHKAGLVTDNLLPLRPDEIPGVEDQHPDVDVELGYDPWPKVARAWHETNARYLHPVTLLDEGGNEIGTYGITLPVQLPPLQPTRIFVDHTIEWKLEFGPGSRIESDLPDHTSTLLAMSFGYRWHVEDREQVIKFTALDDELSREQIGLNPFQYPPQTIDPDHLIRDHLLTPYTFVGTLDTKPPAEEVQSPLYGYRDAPEDGPYLVLKRWAKRADFLHYPKSDPTQELVSSKPYAAVLPVSWARLDDMHRRHAQFGMLIPSIVHSFEVMLVASDLRTSLLEDLDIEDLDLIREAICSRGAEEPVDYERVEFLGDSILKFCAVIQALADHPVWPEGYLSGLKDRLVSNSRLKKASIVKKLTKFILAKAFTGHKWRPLYRDSFLTDTPQQPKIRNLGSKVMADVVESLIGVSHQSGGIPKALKCISIFIDEINWHEEDVARQLVWSRIPDDTKLPPTLEPLERLLGYSFQKKELLIEAMTHDSFVGNSDMRSFERLEFLGDAVLDKIIVTKLFAVEPPLPHSTMHMIKSGMVNSDILAFFMMEFKLPQNEVIVDVEGEVHDVDSSLPCYKFMRYSSTGIGVEMTAMNERYEGMREDLIKAVERGTHYPWALLARMQAKKFFSDLFEALVGAIWVDSGSIETCAKLVERVGILPYMDRILRDNVHIQHPKEEIGKLAGNKTVNYSFEFVEGGDGERAYSCKIHVGGQLKADVHGGVGREEVKTKAAEQAVRVMKEEMAVD